MPTTAAGIHWDDRGPATAPPVLLIEGLSGQMIGWRDAFCDLLVHKGLRVLRMDNRDAGLSRHESGPYSINDMATDAIDVLDDAGIERVTLVGQSMGGMITQHAALNHPERVAGAVLFYTTPTVRDVNPGALVPTMVAPTSKAQAIEAFLDADKATTSPAYGYDLEWKTELAGLMFDRNPDRSGIARQQNAVAAMPDLIPRLGTLKIPVALIHGRADELIHPRGSVRLMEELPQAELHLFAGMGHEVAPALWPDFAHIIARTVRRIMQPQPTPDAFPISA